MACLAALGVGCTTPQPMPAQATTQLQARIAELEAANAALRAELGQSPPAAAELSQQNAALLAENRRLEQLAGVVSVDEVDPAGLAAQITTSRDEATGRTKAQTMPAAFPELRGLGSTTFYLAFSAAAPAAQSDPASAPATLYLLTSANPTNRLESLTQITLEIDGQSVDLPMDNYEVLLDRRPAATLRRNAPRTGSLDERLAFTLDRETLTQLAYAGTAQLRVLNYDLTLTRQQIALARAVLLQTAPQ